MTGSGSVANSIRRKLQAAFSPLSLDIVDDSARHAGHAGAIRTDGSRGETHFRVRIVSQAFTGMSRVERQRKVYGLLSEELAKDVHALQLEARTPEEVGPDEAKGRNL